MGCPVKKVCKTGAGAALIGDPDLAVAVVSAAVEGSTVPVTVKLRSGLKAGDISGLGLAVRLVEEGGASAIGFHPRPATVQHKGKPDYELVRRLTERVEVPVIVSGGLSDAARARRAYELSGADAVMIARGSFGYPWIFEELVGERAQPPSEEEIVAELLWVVDRAEEHLGPRAAHYLRKFYPWYLDRLDVDRDSAEAFQRTEDLDAARQLIRSLGPVSVGV